ncbi:MAG: NUDIX domain-containing protein [Desulfuromonadales bacterium]|nr:NUDIX domain-containing protein [Desulfuromonadales bacterium]
MPFNISDFHTAPLNQGQFVKPVRLHYRQNGNDCTWEAVKCHDSVAILLYHRDKEAFLLVKQFRPAVHMNHPVHLCTYELCAGLVDKDVSLGQIAREEIDEECGFAVPVENISKISSFFTNVGVSGNRQHLFYAEIDDSMKIHNGGGIHSEEIILEYLPCKDARAFIYDESKAKTPGLMFAMYWFWEQR